MGNALEIRPVMGDLPPDFVALLDEARRQGHQFVERFHAARREGGECYCGTNEGVFAAFLDGGLAGIAAIGVDPYLGDPGIGRLRHVFVASAARRRGVAAALVGACLERGRGFDVIRLRTHNPDAARLYERLGFLPVELADASHIYPRSGPG